MTYPELVVVLNPYFLVIVGTATITSTKNGERFTVVFGVKVKDPVKELFKSSFLSLQSAEKLDNS